MSRLLTLLAVSVCVSIPMGAIAQMPANNLPAGEGKEVVATMCTSCHNLNQITMSSGYTQEHWKELISNMVDLSSAPKQQETITKYLATNFPPNTKRAPKAVDGPVKIKMTTWKVPTLGQRSRDPVETPDGMIWWAGQYGNLVGRINPKTGEMKEFPLPMGAKPHSITPDADGNIWYTGNANATIGKIDAKTGEIKVYPMPDPTAIDPHTAVFDKNGTMWFTVQNNQFVGKLVPSTGEVKLVKLDGKKNPYGIQIDSKGVPWASCNASNCVLRIDPQTMAIKEYKIPRDTTTVRRLVIDSNDMIWYTQSTHGGIGRLDPNTGATKEWTSPSGENSHPYAIEIIDDVIWYNESGQRPDMLVRFDIKTEKFQSWPIPSGDVYSGIVRHMRATPSGDLLIHQSATNRIMHVAIED
jgi:virginiamycin B lyase